MSECVLDASAVLVMLQGEMPPCARSEPVSNRSGIATRFDERQVALFFACMSYYGKGDMLIMKTVILDEQVTLNENGRIVIPSAMRKALNVKAGDSLLLHFENGSLQITTRMQRIREAQEMVRKALGPNPDLVDGFIAERREAAKRE